MKLKALFLTIGLLAGMSAKTACAEETFANCATCTPCCEVQDSYPYLSIGVGPLPILFPNFNVGWRQQCGHYGFDVGLNAATALVATQLKGYANWLYYLTPSLSSQMYCGLGVSIGTWLMEGTHNRLIAQPNFIVGRSFMSASQDRTFVQAEVAWPTVFSSKTNCHRSHTTALHHIKGTSYHNKLLWKLPLVTISYGWGF